MLEFMQANWIMFTIGGAILLCAIAGVIVGVVTGGGWKDNGLMVRDEHPLRWSKEDLPIAVLYHPELSFAWGSTFIEAAKRFNLAVGRDVLQLLPARTPADYDHTKPPPTGFMLLRDGADLDTAHTEHRYERESGRILSALVTVSADQREQRMAIMVHELGHVLGLDHDERPASIMYPTISVQKEPGTLSNDDVNLLKRVYG